MAEGKVHFSPEELGRLERIFLSRSAKELKLVVAPPAFRKRLAAQLDQMIDTAILQPRYHLTWLLNYPIFNIYAKLLLGFSPNEFIAYLKLPEATHPSLTQERKWLAYQCFGILETTVASFSRCIDEKKREFIEYKIVCEIEPQNEDQNGIETTWSVAKRYSDFRIFQQQLKKLNEELGEIPFPGKTFLPGRATSPPVIDQRKTQLHEFLSSIVEWIQKKVNNLSLEGQEGEEFDLPSEIGDVIALLDSFLEIKMLDRKAPCSEDKIYSCYKNKKGWFASHYSAQNQSELFCGYNTVNCEVLSILLQENNSIHSIDLSFTCGGSLRNEGFRSLCQSLGENKTGLLHLNASNFQGHNCSNEDIEFLFRNNTTLQTILIAGGVSLSIDKALLGLSTTIPSLQVLDLSGCFKTNPQAIAAILNITPSLNNHKTLRELYLNNNFIGNRGAELIAESLNENDSLEILSLRDCCIGPAGIITLCNVIAESEMIQGFFITNRPSSLAVGAPTSQKVVDSICDMLSANSSLIELDLTRQYLGDTCNRMAEVLARNSSLQIIRLRHNRLTAASFLDAFFQHNQSVHTLDLCDNDLINDNMDDLNLMTNLFDTMAHDQTLFSFGVPWIDDSDISKSLMETLAKNITIKQLEFSNAVPNIKLVEALFLSNSSLEEIIGLESPPKGLFTVHASIFSNVTLRKLHWNQLDSIELKKITEQLLTRKEAGAPSMQFSFSLAKSPLPLNRLEQLELVLPQCEW